MAQNWGTSRWTSGFQMAVATPTKMTSRPRVTISADGRRRPRAGAA